MEDGYISILMNFGSQYFTNCVTVAGIQMPATVAQLVKYCDPKFITSRKIS